jgi:ABC-type polysaccharide/polyol phosphate export permease
MEKKKLVKRKKQGEKSHSSNIVEQNPFTYLLSDVRETVVTESVYQPIPKSILKFFMPKGMI